jgi:hypothetical protein
MGIPKHLISRTHHTMLVDNSISITIRPRMDEAIHAAVGSAYNILGYPAATRCNPCFKAKKIPAVD